MSEQDLAVHLLAFGFAVSLVEIVDQAGRKIAGIAVVEEEC
jgi:hypothetical protein